MRTAVLAIAALAGAWWLCTRNGCRHQDECGRSVLMLTWHDGRDRGWCPLCERYTTGWSAPEPQRTRLPRARRASQP